MAVTGEPLKIWVDILTEMPDGLYYDINRVGSLEFQAKTNEEARTIRGYFPGAGWTRAWNDGERCQWWEWIGEYRGKKVYIYAIEETPKECRAITEKRLVTKQVPVEFKEVEVEEEVIVGWNCGDK